MAKVAGLIGGLGQIAVGQRQKPEYVGPGSAKKRIASVATKQKVIVAAGPGQT